MEGGRAGGAVLALFDLTGTRWLEAVRRDFAANVSHELKTPLTAIRGFAETLTTELASNEQHARFAESIRQNAERMQHLIDDLLDLSRIESGGWSPSPTDVDVAAAAAAAAAAAYRDEADCRGTAIRIAVDRNAGRLRADPVALRQALGNLVENAVRFTPSGGTITIFSRSEDHGIAFGVATRDREFRRSICRASSSASIEWTPRAPAPLAEPGSVWRS